MRALIVDPEAPGRLSLGEAPGAVIGFDAAGAVVGAAADGAEPAVGSRAVGSAEGGGVGALRAMDVTDAAVVPDGVDLGESAALPVAAGTVLRALDPAGRCWATGCW